MEYDGRKQAELNIHLFLLPGSPRCEKALWSLLPSHQAFPIRTDSIPSRSLQNKPSFPLLPVKCLIPTTRKATDKAFQEAKQTKANDGGFARARLLTSSIQNTV